MEYRPLGKTGLEAYGTEEIVGAAARSYDRDRLVISTKAVFNAGYRRNGGPPSGCGAANCIAQPIHLPSSICSAGPRPYAPRLADDRVDSALLAALR